jgi:hypothetical protein
MGIFSKFFNGKNYIDEQIEKINILRVSMQHNEASNQTRVMIHELMDKPVNRQQKVD